MDSLFGMGSRGVVSAAAAIIVASWLLGAGIHLFLRRSGFGMRGAAFTVGLGLMAAAFLIELGYLLADNVFVLLIPGVLVSVGYSLMNVVQALRGDAEALLALRTLLPTWTDWLSGFATLVVLYPLIRHGLVYYTSFINDFPNYAASAEQWLSASGVGPDFLFKHPDGFGPYQLARAQREKPTSTATLVFGTIVSGVPVYSLLGPIAVVTVLVLVGNLAAAIQRAFRSPAITATAAALTPVVSIVPMSRLHDAQLGHAIAVAFLGVLVHASLVVGDATGRLRTWVFVVVMGVLLAVTIGANPTLMLGTGASWGALLLWLSHRSELPWWLTVRRFAAAGVATILVSLPAIGGFRTSLSSQAGGEQGYDIPFPSPLAAIGLQFGLDDVTGTSQTMVAWAFVGAALLLATVVLARNRAYWPAVGLCGAIAINGALITSMVGAVNYATHKWAAVVVAVIMPFLLALLTSLAPSERRRFANAGLVTLTVAAVAVSWNASHDVPVRVPLAVFELANDEDLADLDVVNVQLDDQYRNSIAAMAVPSDQVVVVGKGYAEPAAPIGDHFVLDLETAESWGAQDARSLGDDLVFTQIDLMVPVDEPLWFDSEYAGRFLYGHWFDPEPSGVWTNRRHNRLVFDVPSELIGRDLDVTIVGSRLAASNRQRELIVRLHDVDGEVVARTEFDELAPGEIHMTIPADTMSEGDGRIVLHLETPDAIPARELGYDDDRTLGFLLQRLTVRPAADLAE